MKILLGFSFALGLFIGLVSAIASYSYAQEIFDNPLDPFLAPVGVARIAPKEIITDQDKLISKYAKLYDTCKK